jgi:transcriptional regulator with GAF, ATPase, and Fis domain
VSEADDLASELRAIFSLTATTSALSAPVTYSRLLEMIVQTATHVIGAHRGSLLLIDQAAGDLVFEVSATGEVSELQKIRVPLGEGIAGHVALTGQALAIADAQSDPRHAAEIAQQTGYLPNSLLCVPLEFEDEVIGVIELMDKQDMGSFDASDMHTLGLFARQAAIAIEQSRAQRSVAALLRELLSSLVGDSIHASPDLAKRVSDFAATVQSDVAFRRSLELAGLIHEIAQQGEDEARACLVILRGFAEYTRRRQRLSPQHGAAT